jgi:NhaP-type Na+/H+ or K+/H+ antiporter
MIYLLVGFIHGPPVTDALALHPLRELAMLETITEIALLIALFTVGVKLRVPIGDWRWSLPLRLATLSMLVTIAGIAAAAGWLFGYPPGLALALGAALAPTDPVLASEVQLRSPQDRDALRFGLTGEGGLNDGTAFPFVLLGLGLLGFRDIGAWGDRWLVVDLLWGTVAGLGIGFAVGDGVARGVRALRARFRDTVILDEFLLLGVIALSYGVALAAHALGFLAVFAAGLALRRADDIHADSSTATDKPPLTPKLLNVNEQLERIVEVAIVLVVGAMISTGYWSFGGLALAALLFFVIRPLSVWAGLLGVPAAQAPRRLIGWFGIRGIGSVYYAVFIARHELEYSVAAELVSIVFTVVAASIVIHGVSATPLMELYQRRRERLRAAVSGMSDKR